MPTDISPAAIESLDLDEAATPDRVSSPLLLFSIIALGAAILLSAAFMALSERLSNEPIAHFTYAAALSVGMLGMFQAYRHWSDRRRRLTRSDDAPKKAFIVSDIAGTVIETDDGFETGVRRPIEDVLGMARACDQNKIMRLGREAITKGVAHGYGPSESGRRKSITAARWGSDEIFWIVAEEREWSVEAAVGDCVPAVFLSTTGERLDATTAFRALDEEDRQIITSKVVADSETENDLPKNRPARDEERVRLSDGRAVTIHVEERGDAGRAAIALRADDDGAAFAFFEAMPVAVVLLTPEGRISRLNSASRRLLGDAAAIDTPLGDVVEGLSRPIDARIREAAEGRATGRPELTRVNKAMNAASDHAKEVFLQIAMTRVEFDDGPGIAAVVNDATELKVLEQQFVQSQKMQAVGQLAGGVAHDFNNLLTAIIGHCDLMKMRITDVDPAFEDVTQIRQNANRAAALVRQLLAFSRLQKLNPTLCSIPDVLGELSNLLNRLIGERIRLDVLFEDELWDVYLDSQQFEQVILNLVVNARDAMPDGGVIQISSANVTLHEELKRDRAVVPPGDYVQVEVIDDGVGMNEDIREQVFEPFFTTKGVGEGTGLGLSTVYGIIKQTGGFVFIDSQPGDGATFRILLPRPERRDEAPTQNAKMAQAVDLSGSGVVLIVEDEIPVRAFAKRALALRGYTVLEAGDADAAMEVLETSAIEVDLVISDVVMPGRDGPTWVREARKTRPDLPVIFTSGYSEDVFRKGLADLTDCIFLAKPFTLEELSLTVKRELAKQSSDKAPN